LELPETRVDHWLHDLYLHFWLRLVDHLNHHAQANLRGGDPYLDQMLGAKTMKMDDLKKRKDGWMGAMSYREVFFHPFRTPLFRFILSAIKCTRKRYEK